MGIKIFVTGGTFDKEYNELDGKLFFKDTHLHEMLHLGRCKAKVDVRTLMMVDSLEMTEEDRQIILDNCTKIEGRTDRHHTRDRHDGSDCAGTWAGDQRTRRSCSPVRWCRTNSEAQTGSSISAARLRSFRRFRMASTLR